MYCEKSKQVPEITNRNLFTNPHSREDCLAKVRESQMDEEGREWEILEDEQMDEEAEREWSREVEKEALYISPEISV